MMEIKTANLFDLKALRILETESFALDAWPLVDLVAVLTFPDVIRIKAVMDGRMIGFIAGDPRPSEGWGWIATLAVAASHRRKGVATALLSACERKLGVSKARLTARLSNDGAISLYEKEGYQRIEIWNAYYSDGEDAMVMEKQLFV